MIVESSIVKIVKLLPLISNLSSSSLVLWDFNNTLLMHRDRLIRYQELKNPIFDRITEDFLAKAQDKGKNGQHLMSLAYQKPEAFQVIEPDVFDCLKAIKVRNIPTAVLTSCTVGPYGYVENLHDELLKHLASNHMDFQSFFPQLSGIKIASEGTAPGLFKKGIIFNNNNSKGAILKSFLRNVRKQTGWSPSEIVYS